MLRESKRLHEIGPCPLNHLEGNGDGTSHGPADMKSTQQIARGAPGFCLANKYVLTTPSSVSSGENAKCLGCALCRPTHSLYAWNTLGLLAAPP